MKRDVTIFVAACTLLLCEGAAQAVVRYVDANVGGGLNDGTSWPNAYNDLQTAITTAGSGDELWVAAGTYKPGSARGDTFLLKSGVIFYGGFTNGMATLDERSWVTNLTELSGDIGSIGPATDNIYNVLTAQSSGMLDGFIVRDGYGSARGGGINISQVGGVVIRNCVFRNNVATEGGALGFTSSSGHTLEISNCEFYDNTASGTGYDNGGAIVMEYAYRNAVVQNCLFIGNTARGGGAVGVYHGSTPESPVLFENCTFLNNTALDPRRGHCVSLGYSEGDPGDALRLRNCILWGQDSSLVHCKDYSAVYMDYSCTQSGTRSFELRSFSYISDGGGNLSLDPLFADAAGRDVHLLSDTGRWTQVGWVIDAQSSPCINAGNWGSSCTNEPSPNGSRVNMGMYGNTAQASKSEPALQLRYYVDGGVATSGNGLSWSTAKKTIPEALSLAANGDNVFVKQGRYSGSTITLADGARVYGGMTGSELSLDDRDTDALFENQTIIDGEGVRQTVLSGAGAVLDGFIILRSSNRGIDISHTMTVSNCMFGACSSEYGSGIFINSDTVNIEECIFSGGTASLGAAGVQVWGNGQAFIKRSTFCGGYSGEYGGAFYTQKNGNGQITMENCLVVGNHAGWGGGAGYFRNTATAPQFVNNTFAYNGGGGSTFTLLGSSPVFKNCIVWSNSATDIVFSWDASFITYDTGDVQDGLGGGLNADPQWQAWEVGTWSSGNSYDAQNARTTFTDSSASWAAGSLVGKILAPDIADFLCYYVVSNSSTTVSVLGNATAVGGSGDSYEVRDFYITEDSPCIDIANTNGAPDVDIDGVERPVGDGFDIGAYEYDASKAKILGTIIMVYGKTSL